MSTSATFVDAIEPMDALIGRIAELQRLPAAAQLLLDLTRAEDYDVRAVERCLAAFQFVNDVLKRAQRLFEIEFGCILRHGG